MRTPRTKPGDLARRRRAHLARQRIYDALRRLRSGESVVLCLHGAVLTVAPWPEEQSCPDAGTAVVYVHHGRICVGIVEKSGRTILSATKGYGNSYYDKILGIVTSASPAEPA